MFKYSYFNRSIFNTIVSSSAKVVAVSGSIAVAGLLVSCSAETANTSSITQDKEVIAAAQTIVDVQTTNKDMWT